MTPPSWRRSRQDSPGEGSRAPRGARRWRARGWSDPRAPRSSARLSQSRAAPEPEPSRGDVRGRGGAGGAARGAGRGRGRAAGDGGGGGPRPIPPRPSAARRPSRLGARSDGPHARRTSRCRRECGRSLERRERVDAGAPRPSSGRWALLLSDEGQPSQGSRVAYGS